MSITDKSSQTVKSADRVLDIFELFGEVDTRELSLMDITRRLELPASSVFKILQNLVQRGYLEKDENGKMFHLGYKIFQIGAKYAQQTNLTTEFQYMASQIVSEVNEAVYLAIRSDRNILYIAEKQSTHHVRFVSHLGMKLPLHTTAMGKLFLSAMRDDDILQLYNEQELGLLTDRTISDLDKLFEQLREIRRDGVAFSEGEAVHGIRCAAAPIFNANQEMIAAMSISIPTTRWKEETWSQMTELVVQGAKKLTSIHYYQAT
ncbi:IclR family transcriptional regulator [Paenibacillus sp. CGMCC 1.16610]|uniref:Helix-turn-helix domain-containing protein n=1 Tax=Paenibacillus anseongense TaxID=2682845 RepID=A0ABW9UD81_9BACL|nr:MULTISPECIES: IclR family transcriptional regulator [Paenibacillus]MBA2937645.1 IclR family transcriptional regulator [Paenibacillus sp. CGMCC 1.16610]MVQ36703.1 helix-turn-helix domain-containing protein [Paenibacillus anseongense]